MNPNMPQSYTRDQQAIDADHLRLLSIFHFVGAGFACLGILFLFFHYMMFHAMFHGIIMNPPPGQNDRAPMPQMPPEQFFSMFKWFYLAMGSWFLLSAVLNIISGLFLAQRSNRVFSLVVAAFDCLYVPLGTALGVFTIVVLLRDSVRELYLDNRG